MSAHLLDGIIPTIAVSDIEQARAFYTALLGEPDLEPMEGVLEWEVVPNAWLQVSQDPVRAGHGAVVLSTEDIETQTARWAEVGIESGEIHDYGFIQVAVVTDPDGNQLQVVQVVPDDDPDGEESLD